jgi:hypothetical protein
VEIPTHGHTLGDLLSVIPNECEESCKLEQDFSVGSK